MKFVCLSNSLILALCSYVAVNVSARAYLTTKLPVSPAIGDQPNYNPFPTPPLSNTENGISSFVMPPGMDINGYVSSPNTRPPSLATEGQEAWPMYTSGLNCGIPTMMPVPAFGTPGIFKTETKPVA